MITNDKKLEKLFNGVIQNLKLTSKRLFSYGFDSYDINNLIYQNIIIKSKSDLYLFVSVDKLFEYGQKLFMNKEYVKAELCLKKCLNLNANHIKTNYQLFLINVQNKNYESAFKFLNTLFKLDKIGFKDNNYYLYLLNIITEIPESYKEYCNTLSYDSIKISFQDNRYNNIALRNTIRSAVIHGKFSYAKKNFDKILLQNEKITAKDMLVSELLDQVNKVEKDSRNKVIYLLKSKKYDDAIKYLLNKQTKFNLSMEEQYCILLIKKIIEIKNTMKIPMKKNKKIDNLSNIFEAIDIEDYNSALIICEKRNDVYHIPNDNHSLYILLKEICDLIKTLEIRQKKPDTSVAIRQTKKNVDSYKYYINSVLPSIIFNLKNQKLDIALNQVSEFLAVLDKKEYEFLIVDLIKLGLLRNDIDWVELMSVFELIIKDNFVFNIPIYMEKFYKCLSQNKFEEAEVYLDIISEANELTQHQFFLIKSFREILIATEQFANFKRNNSIIDKIDEIIQNNKIVRDNVENLKNLKRIFWQAYNDLMQNKGIILLKPMEENEISDVLKMANECIDLVAFVIENESQKQVVLRYNLKVDEKIDPNDLIALGSDAYWNKDYNKSIEIFKKLLYFYKDPEAVCYAKLGLAYMKNNDINLAIDYLTVATSLSLKNHLDYDFSNLLLSLKGNMKTKYWKPRVKMKLEEFDYNTLNSFYGIENFEDINSYILTSGLDVESACEKMSISKENVDIIKLIYAREFYMRGDINTGDLFLNSVEKSKNKTELAKKVFEKIRKNKKFYQNRPSENPIKLNLSLKPKKGK